MEDKIYKTGRIYRLYSYINEIYYIGSTHNTLRHRLNGHKSSSGRVSKKVSDWINDIGTENIKIEELHKYENLTAKQLKIYEDKVIREHLGKEFCLNCNRAYRTEEEKKEFDMMAKRAYKETHKEQEKQYRRQNKDRIAEYQKQYREENKERLNEQSRQYHENNKERIAEQQKQRVLCPYCNCEVRKNGIREHERSKKHLDNLQAAADAAEPAIH